METKSVNLYLIRHGQSIQNTHENYENRPDHAIYLTDLGKEQARCAGKFLRKFLLSQNAYDYCLYFSPFMRAKETALSIDKQLQQRLQQVFIWEDDMLVEMNFGLFNNIPKNEIKNIYPEQWEQFQNERRFCGKFFARRPGGESPLDVAVRQRIFLNTLYQHIQSGKTSENIIIVGHGAALCVLKKCIFNDPYYSYESELNPDNCSIQHITLNLSGRSIYNGYIYKDALPE